MIQVSKDLNPKFLENLQLICGIWGIEIVYGTFNGEDA